MLKSGQQENIKKISKFQLMATQKPKGRDYPLSPTPIPAIAPVAATNKIIGRTIVNIPAPIEGRAIVNKGQV
jgi:hypothetical protein